MRAVPVMLPLLTLAFTAPAQDKNPVSFEKDIQPIFKQNCVSCHKPDKKKGKLDMSTYADLMKGGKQGPAVKPGDPAKSLLVQMISGPEPEMPEKGDRLMPEQVELITRWIKEGAKKSGQADQGKSTTGDPGAKGKYGRDRNGGDEEDDGHGRRGKGKRRGGDDEDDD